MHDLPFLVEDDQVDREEHSDGVHAPRRNDPKAAAELRPALGFSKQTNKAAEIVIRNRRLGGHKGFPGLVVHVHVSTVIAVTARHFVSIATAN